MRYFSPIVRVLARVVGDPGHDVSMGHAVAAELVGHETHGFLALTLQEFSEESPRCTPVPTRLDEEVDQVTVLVPREHPCHAVCHADNEGLWWVLTG